MIISAQSSDNFFPPGENAFRDKDYNKYFYSSENVFLFCWSVLGTNTNINTYLVT